MAKQFHTSFFSRDGNAYQIWIEKDSFAGSSTELKPQSDPGIIDWGRRGVDKFTPILGSVLRCNAWREAVDTLDDLITSDPQEYMMRVVKGDTQALIEAGTYETVWLGYPILDNYQDSTMRLPDGITIEAADGLSDLKSIPYWDDSTDYPEAYTGRETARTILTRILAKLGYLLPLRTACRWFPDGVAKTSDPWDNIEFDNAAFISDDGLVFDCYEVLRQLLYRTASILYQYDGNWWAVQPELIDGTNYTVYQYTNAGVADGTATKGAATDLDTALPAGTVLRSAGRRKFTEPISFVSLQYNHGLVPSLIHGGDFQVTYASTLRGDAGVRENYSDFWTLTGSGVVARSGVKSQIVGTRGGLRGEPRGEQVRAFTDGVLFIPALFHGTSRVWSTVKTAQLADAKYATNVGDNVETGQRISFQGSVKIPFNAGNGNGRYMSYWLLWIEATAGNNYYMDSSGAWNDVGSGVTVPTPTLMQYIVPPGDEWGDGGLLLDTEYAFQFISDTVPTDGAISLILYGTSDINGSDLDPEGVEWDDIKVLLVDENNERLEAKLTHVWSDLPGATRETIQLAVGPGPTELSPTRIEWGSTYYTDWESDLLSPARDLDVLTCETWLRFMNRFNQQRYETFVDLEYAMGDAITVDGLNFFATHCSKSLRHARDVLELIRHTFDSASTLNTGNAGVNINPTGGLATGVAGAGASQPGLLTNLAAYVSTQNPIAYTDALLEDGDTVTVITVAALTSAGLLDNDEIIVVDRGTGKPFRFAMSADEADVTWDVDDPDNPGSGLTLVGDIAIGSGIYFANDQLLDLVRAASAGASPITTKGDLIVGDSGGSDARLPVGTDGQVLVADSGESDGVAWKAPTSAVGMASGFVFLGPSTADVTVTPGIDTSLFFATILCCLHTEAAAEEYAPVIQNITATTFEIHAQGTPGEQLKVQWLVIGGTEAAALAGSLSINPGTVDVEAALD